MNAIAPLIERYITAWARYCDADDAVDDAIAAALEIPDGEDWWADISVDPCDWDGVSIELHGAREGLIPTEAQMERVWALGFTVIRIDYKDRAEHRFAGDWWCVKGRPPGTCDHQRARLAAASPPGARAEGRS